MALKFRVRIYTEKPGPYRLFRVVKVADAVCEFKVARQVTREILNMGPTLRLHVKGRFWWHPITDHDAFMRSHDGRAFDSTLKRWRLPR